MQIWKTSYLFLLLAAGCGGSPEAAEEPAAITVTNNSAETRTDDLIRVDAQKLAAAHGITNWEKVKFTAGNDLVPFESFDGNGDGRADEIDLLLNMGAAESKKIFITELATGERAPVFPKRTQAEISHKVDGYWKQREYQEGRFQNVNELRVPPEHTDHSWFIRYEGPGWESDLVGYRFYLDWRNATDVFGKKTSDMVLQKVGLDGFDSYHEPADWGQDVLKVGKSLGIGSLGTWTGDRALRVEETDSLKSTVMKNGLLESTVRTNYYGWKVGDKKTDVVVDLSIHAGSRLTKNEITLSEPLDNLCTGIVKLDGGELLRGEKGNWGYLATWGEQSLAIDKLGLAVLYRKQDLGEITEDEYSHVVVLTPDNNALTYYFLAAWEQEKGGVTSKDAFLAYLNRVVQELSNPLTVTI